MTGGRNDRGGMTGGGMTEGGMTGGNDRRRDNPGDRTTGATGADGVPGGAAGGVVAHIRATVTSLLPTERAVAEVFLARPDEVIEMSAQQVAAVAGASRATVVRTCQSLGFTGYPQLRVLLARDLGPPARFGATDGPTGPPGPRTVAEVVRQGFAEVGRSLPAMSALLDDQDLTRTVDLLAGAGRILSCGNGLSGPLAVLLAQRLSALGRAADAPTDAIAQQIAARHLAPADLLVVISGSGANDASVRCARAARAAGAAVVVLTSFARAPLTAFADITLVVGMRDLTFRDEITVTSRIPQFILLEALIAGVVAHLGPTADRAHAATMAVVSQNLTE